MEAVPISLIAALGASNRAIGRNNDLLWQIPDDMKRFRKLTIGHPVIMGRKTWESIPEKFRPLPKRANFVVTHDPFYQAPGAMICSSLLHALNEAWRREGNVEQFVIGGGQIYQEALPLVTGTLYLTLIDDEQQADTFFPEYAETFSKIVFEEEGEHDGLKYRFVDFRRG